MVSQETECGALLSSPAKISEVLSLRFKGEIANHQLGRGGLFRCLGGCFPFSLCLWLGVRLRELQQELMVLQLLALN